MKSASREAVCAKRSFAGGPACKAGWVWGSATYILEVRNMYKIFVLTLCVGIVMILVSISLICCMNQEKRGYRVQLAGAFVTGAGLSEIVFALFGIGPAILIGLMCVLYIIVNILST